MWISCDPHVKCYFQVNILCHMNFAEFEFYVKYIWIHVNSTFCLCKHLHCAYIIWSGTQLFCPLLWHRVSIFGSLTYTQTHFVALKFHWRAISQEMINFNILTFHFMNYITQTVVAYSVIMMFLKKKSKDRLNTTNIYFQKTQDYISLCDTVTKPRENWHSIHCQWQSTVTAGRTLVPPECGFQCPLASPPFAPVSSHYLVLFDILS